MTKYPIIHCYESTTFFTFVAIFPYAVSQSRTPIEYYVQSISMLVRVPYKSENGNSYKRLYFLPNLSKNPYLKCSVI